MNFVGKESRTDLGGRPNVSDIHQTLTPEEADEIGKWKRAGDSWGFAGEWAPKRGKGGNKTNKQL